jgi:hypothetical protein
MIGAWSAALDAERLVVARGAETVCEVALLASEQRAHAAQLLRGSLAAVSEDGRWAAVSLPGKLLLVDVGRCAPVGIGTAPFAPRDDRMAVGKPERPALRFVGGALETVEPLGVRTWSVPDLVPGPLRGFHHVLDLLDDQGAPVLLGDAQVGPLDGSSPHPLAGLAVRVGDELLTLDVTGWQRLSPAGARLGGESEVPLSSLERAARTADGLLVSDGTTWFDVLRGRAVPAPVGARPDRTADRYGAVDVPDGVRVVGEGRWIGKVLPVRPVSAAVTEDGRTAVTLDAGGLRAWDVATGKVRWTAPATTTTPGLGDAGMDVRVGRTWAALRTGTTSGIVAMLFDATTGAFAGAVADGPIFDDGSSATPWTSEDWREFHAPWPSAEAPSSVPWTARPLDLLALADDEVVQAVACGRAPEVWSLVRADANECRATAPFGRRVPPRGEATWTWETYARPSRVEWLGDGLLVEAGGVFAALGPDGGLRWQHGNGYKFHVVGGVVVVEEGDRVVGLDGRTGVSLWSMVAASASIEGETVWIERVKGSPPIAVAATTGRPLPGALRTQRFHAWTCDADGCRLGEAPSTPSPALTRPWKTEKDAVSGFFPGVSAAVIPTPPPLVKPLSWLDLTANEPRAASYAILTATGVRAVGARGDLAWSAVGRLSSGSSRNLAGTTLEGHRLTPHGWEDARQSTPKGASQARGQSHVSAWAGEPWVVDGVATVAGGRVYVAREQTVTAYDWLTRTAIWTRTDLGPGTLRTFDGFPVWASDHWQVLDPSSGKTLSIVPDKLVGLSSGPGPLRVVVQRADGRHAIVDARGKELRVVSAEVRAVVVNADGMTWIEGLPNRTLACSDTAGGWCVELAANAATLGVTRHEVFLPLPALVTNVDTRTGDVRWAAPAADVLAIVEL